jgi:hypothetical protein
MNDLNNGQTQGVLSDMLQHLQEATPDSDTDFTLREDERTSFQLDCPLTVM